MAEFYDADVSGADPIEIRPGFAALLDRIEGNGVRTVVVEDDSRFAPAASAECEERQEDGRVHATGSGPQIIERPGHALESRDMVFE